MVSYQYMSYLFYRKIHLLRFICCYCTSIYNKYIILLFFICNHHKTLLISQVSYKFLCDIYKHNFLLQTSKSTTFQKLRSPPPRKHWKTELYRGSENCGEGDSDSDFNCLASVILRKYAFVTNQCYRLPWTWIQSIWYCDSWPHFEKRLGRF